MKKSFYILLALFLLSIGVGLYVDFINTPDKVLTKYTHEIQTQLNADYLAVKKELEKASFEEIAFEPDTSSDHHKNEYKRLYEKPYTLLAYKNDSLIRWSNNEYFLPDTVLQQLQGLADFYQLSNAYTYIIRKIFPSKDGEKRVGIGIIPIKKAYQIDKLYQANTFRVDKNIPVSIQIGYNKNHHAILGPSKGTIFLSANDKFMDTPTQKKLLLFYGLAFAFFLSLSNQIANKLSQKNSTKGTLFLVAILTLITIALNYFDPATRLNGLGLLADTLQLKVLNSSLIVVLFNAVTFVWLMSLLNREYEFKDATKLKYWHKISISIALNIALMTGIIVVLEIYDQIIRSSDITISFLTLLQHKLDSLLGLSVMIISLAALVLLALWIIKFVNQLKLSRKERSLSIVSAFIIVFGVLSLFAPAYKSSILFSSALLLPFALDFYISNKRKREPYVIYIWFGLTSLFAASALFFFQNQRQHDEMVSYSKILVEERDTIAEKEILQYADEIVQDTSWNSVYHMTEDYYYYDYGKTQLLILNHLQKSKFLSNNFSNNFYLFNEGDITLEDQGLSQSEYHNKLADAIEIYPYSNLHLLNNRSDGGFSYFVDKDVIIKGVPHTLAIEFKSEFLGSENINSPIFSSNSDHIKLKNIGNYEYATFKNDICIRKRGNTLQNKYYTLPPTDIPSPGQGLSFNDKIYSYYAYSNPAGNVVLIRMKANGFMHFLSLFSMLFFLISILTIGINFLNRAMHFIPKGLKVKLLPSHSFYAKVQSGFLILIYLSFIAIGVTTALHFNNSNRNYHAKRLLRKSGAIRKNLNYSLLDLPDTLSIKKVQEKVEAQIEPLSAIHRMDAINFFDLNGTLVYSSKNEIYLKGVIPPSMNASSFNYLSHNKSTLQIKNEKIGDVSFKVAYFPVEHTGDVVGYLGIPYYTKKQARLNDLNDFVSRLLVAYIALFISALALIVFGSRFLTAPIKRLSDAIKQSRDEEIEWESEDEFKDFVEIYNQRLREKAVHHQLVVKMEKETAWRDMAKQVAHDIKNPLTPIMLHIQHFQRSIHDRKMDMEQIEERTDRVTKIILTQIDSLLRKVANFQDVANVAEGARENVQINKVLSDISMLYENETYIRVKVELPPENIYVYGNKGQMERVFSNLVKNAVQAIPEDRPGEVTLSLALDEEFAVIQVKDNGSGIPSHMADKVFTPNFTTKNSGTGLGLHICKSIIETHNGVIDFVTEQDKGTLFTVRLKASRIMSNLTETA